MARKRSRKHSRRHTSHRRRHATRTTRRRRSVALANPRRRHRRRRHLSNPGFRSARGILGSLFRGAKTGAWVFAGELGTGLITSIIPLSSTGIVGLGVRAAAATVSGIGIGMINREGGALALAGGFASIYRSLATEFAGNVPLVGNALAQASMPLGIAPLRTVAPTGAAGYVAPGMRGYVQPGMGDYAGPSFSPNAVI